MSTAFQPSAFQNNAFQIDEGTSTAGQTMLQRVPLGNVLTRDKYREVIAIVEAGLAEQRRIEEKAQAQALRNLERQAQVQAELNRWRAAIGDAKQRVAGAVLEASENKLATESQAQSAAIRMPSRAADLMRHTEEMQRRILEAQEEEEAMLHLLLH